MEIELTVTKKFDVSTLRVSAGARYWEDATVNGKEDTDGTLIPFRNNDYWQPVIDLESGIIQDWPKGTTAEIHYKVCDDGMYQLKSESGEIIKSIRGYVPDILCPKDSGYGDYIIMDIDGNGQIQDWEVDLSGFIDSDKD